MSFLILRQTSLSDVTTEYNSDTHHKNNNRNNNSDCVRRRFLEVQVSFGSSSAGSSSSCVDNSSNALSAINNEKTMSVKAVHIF